jgi:hypothetical protein
VAYQGTKSGENLRRSLVVLAWVLTCVASVNGQVTVGEKLKLLMNGNLGAVYTGSFGDSNGSSHSLGLGINGTLEGYYFHPQFLSFQVRPYYDRAQFNAESQAITRGTGVDSSLSLFGGSHFPGSISYGRNFNNNSEFRIAGVPSVLGDSAGSNFSIGWGALFSGYPTLQASYSIADSTSTLLGTTNQGKSSSKSFNLNSTYSIGGFNLQGTLGHYNTDLVSPDFLTAGTISSESSNTHYGVTAMRRLPLSGNLGLGWSRTTSSSGMDDFTSNSYTASAGVSPWRRFSVNGLLNYTTNALVAFAQSLGVMPVSPLESLGTNSNQLYMNATGTFIVGYGINISGYMNHRIRRIQGDESADTQYGGTVNFQKANNLLGFLRFSIGVVDTATQEGNGALGLVTTLGMTRKVGRWETTADFNYSQDTQTLFGVVTTSNYNYGGLIRRRINSSTLWSTTFRESRSGLTSQAGNKNIADSVTTNLSWEKYSLSGSYSRAKGEALLGVNGTLTATPVGSIVSDYFLTFNARSLAATASTQLFRVLTISGGYTKVTSDALRMAVSTFSRGDRYNARLTIRMRRLYITAGFDRAKQESSVVPGGPRTVNSYYVSLSRWFNVF